MGILATSREGLAVAGEVRYRVPSLSIPERHVPPPPDMVPAYEAVRLVEVRAEARSGRISGLNEQNAASVAAITALRLDGIPLRHRAGGGACWCAECRKRWSPAVTSLPPAYWLGPRDALPRQQTLQAALDWELGASGRGLSNPCCATIACSPVAGPWPEPRALCPDTDMGAGAVLDVLAALAAKSPGSRSWST